MSRAISASGGSRSFAELGVEAPDGSVEVVDAEVDLDEDVVAGISMGFGAKGPESRLEVDRGA